MNSNKGTTTEARPTSPLSSSAVPPETSIRKHGLVARIALVVSIVGLFLSGLQYCSGQAFQKKMARPELAFSLDVNLTNFTTSYNLENIGTGPAFVKWFEASLDGIPQVSWANLLSKMEVSPPYVPVVILPDAVSWPAETKKTLVSFVSGEASLKVKQNHERIDLRICYCSVFDQCWIATQGGLEKNKPTASCEPLPNMWFGHGYRDKIREQLEKEKLERRATNEGQN